MTAATHRHPPPPATVADAPLKPGWERDGQLVVARLSELIAGVDTIGSFAIPYARLPRRLSASGMTTASSA